MNNIKNLTIVAVVAIVAGLLGGSLNPKEVKTTETIKEVQLGALNGPNIPNPYLGWGGVREWRYRQSLQTGTNTIAFFQTPASTSTLDFLNCRFDSGSTTAMTIQFAKNPTQYGTTTLIAANGIVAANSGGFASASSTFVGSFPPNSFVTVGAYGTVSGTVSPTGSCTASFIES